MLRSAFLLCGAAALASAAAAPSPGGGLFGHGGTTPYDGYLKPDVHHGATCLPGPEVRDDEWKHARKGNHRDGDEHFAGPLLRSTAGLQVAVERVGDGILGAFAHYGCRNGITLMKLEVWGHDGLNGVRLTYHDGEQFAAGEPVGCYNAHAFKPNERLTVLQHTDGGRVVTFATSSGGKFAFRLRSSEGDEPEGSPSGHHNHDVRILDVHSGFICGISGNDAGGLDALAFHFAPRANFVSLVIDRDSFTPEQLTVTDHTPVLNNINIENEPKFATRSLNTRAYTYKADSNLGYWAETVVQVSRGDDPAAEAAAPFDVEFSLFKDTREFELKAPDETLNFEIPPRSECTVHVTERVANAFVVRWTGTETFFMDDGTSFSMKIGGTLRGFDVIRRSVDTDCFPIGLVHSWHKDYHDWEGGCVGAKCKQSKDCCGDLECVQGTCQSGVLFPPVEPPLELLHAEHVHTYLRQCVGAKCKYDKDCCGDLQCNPSTNQCESPYLLHGLRLDLASHLKSEWWEAEDHHAEGGEKCSVDEGLHHAVYDGDEPENPERCGHAEGGEKCSEDEALHHADYDGGELAKPECGGHADGGEKHADYDGDEPPKPECCGHVEGGEKCSVDDNADYDGDEQPKPECCGHVEGGEKCSVDDHADYDGDEPPKPECCGHVEGGENCSVDDHADYDGDEQPKPECCGHAEGGEKCSVDGHADYDGDEPPKLECCGHAEGGEKCSVDGHADYDGDEPPKPECCGHAEGGEKCSVDDHADYAGDEPSKPECCGHAEGGEKCSADDHADYAGDEPPKPECCGHDEAGEKCPVDEGLHHDNHDGDEPPKPECCGHAEGDDDAKSKCCAAEGHHAKEEGSHPVREFTEPGLAKPECCDVEGELVKPESCDVEGELVKPESCDVEEESAKPKCGDAKKKKKKSKKQKHCKKSSHRKAKGRGEEELSSYPGVETFSSKYSKVTGIIIRCQCPNCCNYK